MSGHIYIYCFACREQKAHSVLESDGVTVLRCASCNATAHSQTCDEGDVAKSQHGSAGITLPCDGNEPGLQRPTSSL